MYRLHKEFKLFDYSNETFEETLKFDYILPRKIEKFNKAITIPTEITDLLMIYMIVKNKLYDKSLVIHLFEDFADLPQISASLVYYDIGGKKYSKDFNIQIWCSQSTWNMYAQRVEEVLRFHIEVDFKQLDKKKN